MGKRAKAGKRVTPRIGYEVVIDYERGNPDRPMVISPVYNQRTTPPYQAPGYRVRNAPPYMLPQ